jgi:hypothetical protein
MSEDERAAALADALQAGYFRGFLERQRAVSVAQLGECVQRLNLPMTKSERSQVRRAMRVAVAEIRAINRMIEALDDRFPPDVRVPSFDS